MLLTPDRYAETSTEELLTEASLGRVGVDHAWINALLARDPEDTAAGLVAFYDEMDEEVRIDLSAELFHILRALRSTAAIPVYIDLLHDAEDDDPTEIYEALAELGAAAIDPLLEIHTETGPESQANIEFLLAGLRVEDPRIDHLLEERLASDPADAAINLSLYGRASFKPLIEKRIAALDSAAESYAHDKHELEFALDQLSAVTIPDTPEPFNILEHYPETAPPVFDVLEPVEMLAFLEHPDAETRRLAVESLGNEKLDEAETAQIVALAESDPDITVRAQAWQSLAGALEDEGVKAKIEEKFADADSPALERAGAACALAEGEVTETLIEGLERFYQDPATRALALKAMWHSLDRSFADRFPPHLEDGDRDVQRQAIWGTGYLGVGHAAGALEKLFDDPDVRDHALFAYALSCPGEVSRGRAKGLFKKIFDLAGGLSAEEVEIVESAIDQRLSMHGLDPVFHPHRH
ncbi:MAG: HEAT repeat domain-containing protein [Acidobacteria bacterium]|nr:HEAT repeat domain-containing protein [Acidobacteriota bacterium]